MSGRCGRVELSLPPADTPCNDPSRYFAGMKTMKLKDQVAIVTGAGRNIGEEVAKLFAKEGAKIAVVDMDKPRGQRVAAAIKAAGGDAEAYATDVSKGADVAAKVKAGGARFGEGDGRVTHL